MTTATHARHPLASHLEHNERRETKQLSNMATEQESAYETQRKLGLEYDWTEDDGRIVLSRWSGTQESRWRVEQIQIHKDGKVTLFMP